MAATLTVEAKDERDELRRIVASIMLDYPFSPDLEGIEMAIERLNVCARLLCIADDGHGPADDSVLAELRDEEKDCAEGVSYETLLLDRISSPDADQDDWCGRTLVEAKIDIEATRDQAVRDLETLRRLIARAEAAA